MTQKISSVNIETATLSSFTGPTISSVAIANSTYVLLDDTAVSNAGGYAVITGTNFVSGAQVLFGSTSATAVSFVNSTTLNVQVPALTAGSYVMYVQNPDGSTAIRLNGITSSPIPVWATGSTLTSQVDGVAISISLSASSDSNVSYSLANGSSLPSGTTLASNGLFSGTITGLTNDTTYNFTVNAIDAENQDTSRAFSVTVTAGDQNFKDTVLLLNGETSNNTWITDTSTNNFALTVNGDTRPVAFSPYETVWSNFFDGTGDFLSVPDNDVFHFGNGSFTIETWFNLDALPSASGAYTFASQWKSGGAGNSLSWFFYLFNSAGTYQLYLSYSTTGTNQTNLFVNLSSAPIIGTWNHVALVRSGNSLLFFLNGIQVGTTQTITDTLFNSTDFVYIGAQSGGTMDYFMRGYLSNFRIVKGTAVYTSAFTPPTSPLTAIANTSLLTCQSNRLRDASTNNFTITKNGDVTVSNFGPFVETDITTGSGYFDGTGDYLNAGSNAAFSFGTGAYTVELWVYPSNLNAQCYVTMDTTNGSVFYFESTGSAGFTIAPRNGSPIITGGYSSLLINSWNHVVFVRGSTATNQTSIFVNGTRVANGTDSTNWSITGPCLLGGLTAGTYILTGYMSNVRVVKGTAVYDPSLSTLTVPTSPLTAITNTSLLTLQSRIGENNNRFIDVSGINNIITRSGNTSQGTFSPFQRGGWSNYFDGSGDYLTIADNVAIRPQSSDFTMEAWVYFLSLPGAGVFKTLWANRSNSSLFGGAAAVVNSSGNLLYYLADNASTGWQVSGTSTGLSVSLNSWQHIALVRSGNTVTMYKNGVAGTSTSVSGVIGTNGNLSLMAGAADGSQAIDGYMSNFRMLKGTALYTSNFTAPTLPLTPIANTTLLTCADSGFIDKSANNFTITRNGDVSVQPFSPFKVHTYTANTHSVYFDGTGDFLQIPQHSSFNLGTGAFTVEAWVYLTAYSGGSTAILSLGNGAVGTAPFQYCGWCLLYDATGTVYWYRYDGTEVSYTTSSTIPLNTWTHVCAVRNSSSNLSIYINGTRYFNNSSVTTSYNNVNTNPLYIGNLISGNSPGTNRYVFGYISNARVVAGTAVYDPTQATITVPTSPLTVISNTSLLTCSSNTIVDLSTANTGNVAHSITVSGNTRVTTVNPLGFTVANSSGTSADYSITNEGGSMYFDGTGDYLTVPDSEVFEMSGDFTVEAFFYLQSLPGSGQFADIVTKGAAGVYQPYYFFINASGSLLFYSSSTGTSWDVASAVSLGTIITGSWYHLAVSRSGSNLRLFLNGNLITTISNSNALTNNTRAVTIGARSDGTEDKFVGYITNVRINKGTGVYTTSFVPPTSPLTPIAGTTLLVNGTNGSIFDYTRKNNLETVGNVQIRNNIKKYGNTSMYFDGTGDYIYQPSSINYGYGTGNFTIEFWLYLNSTGLQTILSHLASNPQVKPHIYYSSGVRLYVNGSDVITGGTVTISTWTHIAIVRNSGSTRLYINGTQSGSTYTDSNDYGSSSPLIIADYGVPVSGTNQLNAYIDDLRITKGVARYTSNFTAPTTPHSIR